MAGQPLAKVRRKNRALVFYLAAHDRPLTRDHLLALFWPDHDRAAAQHILRTMLSDLRKATGERLYVEDETLRLASDTFVDARTFAAALESPHGRALGEADAPALLAALDLYRGPFLEGFTLADSPEFDDWTASERDRYRIMAIRGFVRAAHIHEGLRDYGASLQALERGLAFDPMQEDLQRDAMRLHYLNGDRAGAVRRFEALCKVLGDELGVPPMPETRALYDAIITDTLAASPAVPQAAPAARAAERLRAPTGRRAAATPDALPFVGRSAELSTLRGLAGSGKLILIAGEPGIGKTRLAEEFIGRSVQDAPPVAVLRGIGHELEQGLPYHPIMDALRTLLALPEWPAWRRELDLAPLWLADVIRLVPELQTSFPAVPPQAQPADETRVWASLLRFLQALGRRCMVCLFLDDLHWADEATIGWLGYAARSQQAAAAGPILLATTRPVDDRSRLATLVRDLLRHDLLAQLSLEALPPSEVHRVAEHLSPTQSKALAEWLNLHAEGNPYFLTELVRLARQNGSLSSDGKIDPAVLAAQLVLPPTIQSLIQSRLLRLPENARHLLRSAAAVGQHFDFELVRQVAFASEDEALEALEQLQGVGLLRPYAPEVLTFDHNLTLQVVVQDMGEMRLRHLHRRVAEVLERTHRDRPDAAGLIARHFLDGHAPERAAPHAYRAGQYAASLAAWVEAMAHYESALAAAPSPSQQALIYLDLGFARFHKGDFASATADFQTAVRLAGAIGSLSVEEAAYLALSMSLFPQTRYADSIALGRQLRAAGPPELAACAEFIWGSSLVLDSAHPVEAEYHLREAEKLLDGPSAFASAITRPQVKYALAGALGQQGRFAEAIALYRSAFDLARSDERQLDLLRRILLHNNLAYYLHLVGDPEASEQIQAGIRLARERGSLSHLAYLYSTAGEIALAGGDVDAADDYFIQGLDLARQVPVPERIAGLTANLGLVAKRRGQDELAGQRFRDAARSRGQHWRLASGRTDPHLACPPTAAGRRAPPPAGSPPGSRAGQLWAPARGNRPPGTVALTRLNA